MWKKIDEITSENIRENSFSQPNVCLENDKLSLFHKNDVKLKEYLMQVLTQEQYVCETEKIVNKIEANLKVIYDNRDAGYVNDERTNPRPRRMNVSIQSLVNNDYETMSSVISKKHKIKRNRIAIIVSFVYLVLAFLLAFLSEGEPWALFMIFSSPIAYLIARLILFFTDDASEMNDYEEYSSKIDEQNATIKAKNELKQQEASLKYQKELDNYNEILETNKTKWLENLDVEQERWEKELSSAKVLLFDAKSVLNRLYSLNIIYDKYRKNPDISHIADAIFSGRADTLEHAYNLFETENRLDTIGISVNSLVQQINELIVKTDSLNDSIQYFFEGVERDLSALELSMNNLDTSMNEFGLQTKLSMQKLNTNIERTNSTLVDMNFKQTMIERNTRVLSYLDNNYYL